VGTDILAPAMAEKLDELHLADLHELASELGVPRFRLLRRPELAREIEARRGGGEPPVAEPGPEPEREPEPEPEVEREPEGEEPEPEGEEPEEPKGEEPEGPEGEEPEAERERERLDTAATEAVTGVLEITPQRYGFLRLNGLETDPDDVYISASQVRRCELRPGDEVSGPARSPRRGERHRALVHVDRVNGGEPLAADRPEFEQLTPIVPKRRLGLDLEPSDVLTRAADLLAPLAFGQRVLVMSAPRSGRTTLLRGLARAVRAVEGPELIVLLIDERPEEATAWREALPDAQIATATAELAPAEQVRIAELALQRALRRAEAGADVVLVVDSLSRLAVAAGDAAEVKRLFGSGRDLAEEGTGSLTVIATVVAGAEDDGAAERAVMTTESSLIRLDPDLAAAGVVPALRPGECRVSNEEELREPEELAAVRRLRTQLADLTPVEAATLLRERIEGSRTNAELLTEL
jgi:transcription termination factor Rho